MHLLHYIIKLIVYCIKLSDILALASHEDSRHIWAIPHRSLTKIYDMRIRWHIWDFLLCIDWESRSTHIFNLRIYIYMKASCGLPKVLSLSGNYVLQRTIQLIGLWSEKENIRERQNINEMRPARKAWMLISFTAVSILVQKTQEMKHHRFWSHVIRHLTIQQEWLYTGITLEGNL